MPAAARYRGQEPGWAGLSGLFLSGRSPRRLSRLSGRAESRAGRRGCERRSSRCPKMTRAFGGRLRSALAQSVAAGWRSGRTPSSQTRHIPSGTDCDCVSAGRSVRLGRCPLTGLTVTSMATLTNPMIPRTMTSPLRAPVRGLHTRYPTRVRTCRLEARGISRLFLETSLDVSARSQIAHAAVRATSGERPVGEASKVGRASSRVV